MTFLLGAAGDGGQFAAGLGAALLAMSASSAFAVDIDGRIDADEWQICRDQLTAGYQAGEQS